MDTLCLQGTNDYLDNCFTPFHYSFTNPGYHVLCSFGIQILTGLELPHMVHQVQATPKQRETFPSKNRVFYLHENDCDK